MKVPLNDIYLTYSLHTPVIGQLNPYAIACRDADSDGYFNWGISSDGGGACGNVPPIKDCDDSDPTLALMTGVASARLRRRRRRSSTTWSASRRSGAARHSTQGCTLPGEPNVFAGTYSFDATLRNQSTSTLSNLVIEVAELSNQNRLQNADDGPTGSRLTVPQPLLAPNQSVDVHFVLCLRTFDPFRLMVNMRGSAQ